MMSTLKNSVQLIGKIGRDVELVTFDSGMKKANVSLATDMFYVNSEGERVKLTEWHNIIAWGKLASLMHSLVKKGNDVAVHGRLAYRNYTDKNGVEKYVTEIVIHDFYKISKMNTDQENSKEHINKEEVEVLPF